MTLPKINARADADAGTEQEADAEHDAEAGGTEHLKKFIADMTSMMDGFGKRMDAFEKARKDAEDKEEEEKAKDDGITCSETEKEEKEHKEEEDKPKELAADNAEDLQRAKTAEKDSDDDEEKEEKKADAMADAVSKEDYEALKARLADMERVIPRRVSDEEMDTLYDIQAQADEVFSALGKRGAPRPMEAEAPMGYRKRLARELKSYSDTWKDKNLHAIADDAIFAIAEKQIYADAMTTAHSPALTSPGTLRGITKRAGGHEITEYAGETSAWMDTFAGPVRLRAEGDWKLGNIRGY